MRRPSTWLADHAVAIFLFHGVIAEQRHAIRNYTNKHLTRERFIAVLDELCAGGVPVSMGQVVAAHGGGAPLPRCAFAITFDDGFENNYSIAAPVLRERRVPATFYVTTDFVSANTSSWTDLIEYAVERAAVCRLSLPFPGLAGHYTTREEKLGLMNRIRAVVKENAAVDPYQVASDVWDQLGVTAMEADPALDQKMSWEQVRALSREPLFTIGGHGHTHRILEFLNAAELEQEIATSLRMLREEFDRPIEHYSYPEGLSHCYSDRVIRALQAHGIQCAVTAEPGTNSSSEDLFRLKRISVTA